MYGPWPPVMNRGVPPTAPKARTGELTPPGTTRRARANRSSDFSMPLTGPDYAPRAVRPGCGSLAKAPAGGADGPTGSLEVVGEPGQHPHRVGQRTAVRRAQPGDRLPGRERGRRRQDVTVAAVPAQARHAVDGLGPAVEAARPPLVLV